MINALALVIHTASCRCMPDTCLIYLLDFCASQAHDDAVSAADDFPPTPLPVYVGLYMDACYCQDYGPRPVQPLAQLVASVRAHQQMYEIQVFARNSGMLQALSSPQASAAAGPSGAGAGVGSAAAGCGDALQQAVAGYMMQARTSSGGVTPQAGGSGSRRPSTALGSRPGTAVAASRPATATAAGRPGTATMPGSRPGTALQRPSTAASGSGARAASHRRSQVRRPTSGRPGSGLEPEGLALVPLVKPVGAGSTSLIFEMYHVRQRPQCLGERGDQSHAILPE